MSGNLSTDVCNQALDAALVRFTMGDIEEGTRPAQVCLRWYSQCVVQLLRGAHWNYARKCAPMQLLADASGQTPNVGNQVIIPWMYEYAYPTDCAKARFVPGNPAMVNPPVPQNNIQPPAPGAPIVTGLGSPLIGQSLIPVRWLEATDFNYVQNTVNQLQQNFDQQGIGRTGRTVILTNQPQAQLVYTAMVMEPSLWDAKFRDAVVAYLAAMIAGPLHDDPKFGIQVRNQQLAIAKDKILSARMTDGNESWSLANLQVDWMRFRAVGGGSGNWLGQNWGNGGGYLCAGWDSISFGGGTAF